MQMSDIFVRRVVTERDICQECQESIRVHGVKKIKNRAVDSKNDDFAILFQK